ncbi:phosphoglycerate mutase family protein [Trichomonas vaginalis G3]|uniref:phosphoglycerate mutase (2,3-diphosphoglycerate-dependent) n=1 Tax=Trichomonas vaginalis (strain ATCC PRA-98 / G3) TaxID=412133 RepID=A2DEG1_TRIV3|nr:histidine phosphatase superfamily (branch 1) family [Trichomonas vaginalis G3]EAY21088.1 phosphoglycerate mutase family protein [Trichomonas vaginalis G3]KAI5539984.1 histidine phosphatase superfamily (branch 1) family [Trichomonas vaginalis G3]|eukprot:XP_001582074.1 phosphoglycerate mutase family protein [Trichomonas vaginalis G3]
MLKSSTKYFTKIKQSRMPVDLILIRNGTSEGNVAIKRARLGSRSEFSQNFCQMHNSRWRLTEFGIMQAKSTGEWLKANFKQPFTCYLTGEYASSLETAACLELEGAKWIPSLYLRPRDYGTLSQFDFLPDKKELQRHMKDRELDTFYWAPPNGESIAHLTLRTERVMHWLRTHVPENGTAVIVTHRDVMETFRIRLEQLLQFDYNRVIVNAKEPFKLNHCSLLHYTRRNPETGEIGPLYQWMKVNTPWMGKQYSNRKFVKISPPGFTNENLLERMTRSNDKK